MRPTKTIQSINRRIRQCENVLHDLESRRGTLDWQKPADKAQMEILDEKITAIQDELCEAQEELNEQQIL